MQALIVRAQRVACSRATVLVTGASGTGKEMFARALHAFSGRKGPFVAVNCGALSDSLADAELFGHEKGAYTGAQRTQAGWFEAAQGGTLLLDEIGELNPALQVKLLRVLQEREVTRVGSRIPTRIDVRVIAATNVDLAAAVAAKRFREDLLFRLNVSSFNLPPLAGRSDAIRTLALHFLRRHAEEHGCPNWSFSDEAMRVLCAYRWPGNTRELENVVQNAVLYAQGSRIEAEHIQLSAAARTPAAQPLTLDEIMRPALEKCIRDGEQDLFNRVTRMLVQSAFDMSAGNQLRAAEYLGMSRHAFRTHLSRLGIIPRRRRAPTAPYSAAHRVQLRPRTPPTLRIGYQKYGTLSLLKAQRLLTHEFPDMELLWTEFPAGPQLLDALQAGDIDFGGTGEVPPIFAQANHASLLYVAHEPPAPCGVALVVPCESQVRSVAELRGMRIVLNKGSNVHYLLVQCLAASGLSLEHVEPVYVEPGEYTLDFKAHGADAWATWDPLLAVALRSGRVRLLKDGTGLVANHQFHLASSEFALRHPRIVNSLLDNLREVGRCAVNNPERVARSVSSELGIDASSLEIAIGRLSHGAKPLDEPVICEQQTIADRFYALGLIPRRIDVRDAVWSAPRH